MKISLLFATFIFIAIPANAQNVTPLSHDKVPVAEATKTNSDIQIDGQLTEEAWGQTLVYSGFVQMYPFLSQPVTEKTEFRILYDEKNLYVGVYLYDRDPKGMI